MSSVYPIIGVIAGAMYVYYIKLYTIDYKIHNLILGIIFTLLLLFATYKLFLNKNNSFLFVSVCIKIIPVIILTLISIFILREEKFTIYDGAGIILILGGTLLLE